MANPVLTASTVAEVAALAQDVTTLRGMTLAQGVAQTIPQIKAEDMLNKELVKQDVSDKWALLLFAEGGAEGNPILRYIGLGLQFRTPLLVHPTKAHDARQQVIDDAFAEASQAIRIRGNIFNFIAAVKKYAAINEHIKDLNSIDSHELVDEIARANEKRREQLALITSMLIIPLEDLPVGSNIVITDAEINMGQVEAVVQRQGVGDQQKARLAGFSFGTAVENVRGNLEVSKRSILRKVLPSHLTFHFNPTRGSTGGGIVGWLIGFVTPEWKVFSPFDTNAQTQAITESAAVWHDARLKIYQQLRRIRLDLHANQVDLKIAQEAWEKRGDETDVEKLVEMSSRYRNLQEIVAEGQLAAMNMGLGAALVEDTSSLTEEYIISDTKDFVEAEFVQGAEDMRKQVQEWEKKLEADHKDKKKVPQVLDAVKNIQKSMEDDELKDGDISGLPVTDATGGVTVGGLSFILGLPSPAVAYTSGASSNSPDAPTFIHGLNEGITFTPIFKKGGKKETKDWERQMTFAQKQSAAAQHGEGDKKTGPKEFRQAMYNMLTSSLAQEIAAAGQGFNIPVMLMHMRSSTPFDSYSVVSLPSLDPVHFLASKLIHHNADEDGAVILARAMVERFKMEAKEAMFQALADPVKGPNYQAWKSYIDGEIPYILPVDNEGKPNNDFIKILGSLRLEFKSGWEKGPMPGTKPLELRLMRLDLETAQKLISYPSILQYWSAFVAVRVGSNGPPLYWEGLRSGVTINAADRKRAKLEATLQITQKKDELERKEAEWQGNQAALEAERAANSSLQQVLAHQSEESPIVVQAPEAQWLNIANAVAAEGSATKELAELDVKGKNPRSIVINILASVQLHPDIAEEMLGGISVPLFRDWARRATMAELNAWIKQRQYQAKVDTIATTRGVNELFTRQKFAMEDFKKADIAFKKVFAQWQAVNHRHAEGLYAQVELDKVTSALERATNTYLFARKELGDVSGRLVLTLSVLGDHEKQKIMYNIDLQRVEISSIPDIELSRQYPLDFYARLLAREFVGSLEENILSPLRDALTNADLTPQQLEGVVSAVYQVGGNASVQNTPADRLNSLLRELPGAITYIRTGSISQRTVQLPAPAIVESTVSVEKPGSAEHQARVLLYRFVVKSSITPKLIKPVQDMLKQAGVSDIQLNKIINLLDAMGMGNNATTRKTVNDRLNLLLHHLSEAIKKVNGQQSPSSAGPKLKGGVDMNADLLDLNEHTDGNNVPIIDEKALELIPIDGVVPRVLQLVPVTSGMFKTLLGEAPG